MGENPVGGRGETRSRISRNLLIWALLASLAYEFIVRPCLLAAGPGVDFPSILDAEVARAILTFLAGLGF